MLALPGRGEVAGRPYREVLRHPRYAELAQAIEAGMKARHRLARTGDLRSSSTGSS